MKNTVNLKKSLKSSALAAPLILGFAAHAMAHSEGTCANNVVDACNAAGGSTEAVNLCIINGLNACHTHSHGGGGNADPASNDKATESEPEARRPGRFTVTPKRRTLTRYKFIPRQRPVQRPASSKVPGRR